MTPHTRKIRTGQVGAKRAGLGRNDESGQALIEMAMVITLLVSLSIGLIEAGRAFMIINMITNVARDAARSAAAAPPAKRDQSGNLTATAKSTISNQVTSQVAAVDSRTTISGVAFDQTSTGGINIMRVTVNGTVPLMFNFIGTSIPIARVVTFRDEGK